MDNELSNIKYLRSLSPGIDLNSAEIEREMRNADKEIVNRNEFEIIKIIKEEKRLHELCVVFFIVF